MRNIIRLSILTLLLLGLSSCAVQTLIKKSDLDVQTKMSATIFLEPVAASKRIIYVDIRNTSDKELNIEARIKGILNTRGYTITDDPDKANFMLQANILKIGKSDLRESESALAGGFGGGVIGWTLASGAGEHAQRNATLAGGIIGFVVDAMVEDILYNMVTDIQVRERPLAGEIITQQQTTEASQGTNTSLKEKTTGGQLRWKSYRSRIISIANKANLEFDEAQPALENGLVKSISGIF